MNWSGCAAVRWRAGTKQKARKQRVDELLQLRLDSGDETVSMALAGRRLGKKALDATGLTKTYGTMPVVNGVTLRLEPGERVGILGPNGAGKSTLLDMLVGQDSAGCRHRVVGRDRPDRLL